MKGIEAGKKVQMIKVLDRKIAKMMDEKRSTPTLIIPKSILIFVKSAIFENFMCSIYEYSLYFSSLIKKYGVLREKVANRFNSKIIFLQKQKEQLINMEKQLSYQYAEILLEHSCRSTFKDQFFFETLIYIIAKVIKDFFLKEDFHFVEEEINRLFRTNRYNLIKKRHQKDQILKQFPALKEPNSKFKVNLTTLIAKTSDQIQAFRTIEHKHKNKQNSKYDYSSIMGIKEVKDERQRSPLICTWLPSKKSMLNEFMRPRYTSFLKKERQTSNEPRSRKFSTIKYPTEHEEL